jgi:hypothetical protein
MNALQHLRKPARLTAPLLWLPVNEGYVELVREESQVVRVSPCQATRWCPCRGNRALDDEK